MVPSGKKVSHSVVPHSPITPLVSKTFVFCPMLRIAVGAFCYAVTQKECPPLATPVTHNGKLRSLPLSFGSKRVLNALCSQMCVESAIRAGGLGAIPVQKSMV